MTDEELVAVAQAGDDVAMNELIERYTVRVRWIGRTYYCPGNDRDDAHQEGFIGFIKAIRDFDPKQGSSFSSFATLAISRQLITMVKAGTRQKHYALNSAARFEAPTPFADSTAVIADSIADTSSVDPVQTLLHAETASLVVSAVCDDAKLSNMEAEVFLGYLKQQSYLEISQRLGFSPKAVDNALQRGTKKVGKAIRERVSPLFFNGSPKRALKKAALTEKTPA